MALSEGHWGRQMMLGKRSVRVFADGEYEIKRVEPHIDGLKETWATGTVLKANASGKFFGDYIEPRKDEDGLSVLYKVDGIGEDGLGYRYFTGPKRADATKGKFFSGVPNDRRLELAAGDSKKYKPVLNWQDFSDSFGNCRHEGNVDFGAGKKPVALLKKIISMATSGSDQHLILDFFAGSGTSGHAALELNSDDGGNRRFILVQLPEKIDGADFPNIASMTKQRLRNVVEKLKSDNPIFAGDLGFRVFKLASSNIRSWEPDGDKLDETLFAAIDHLKADRTESDILYELLLKLGLDLCVPIETKYLSHEDTKARSEDNPLRGFVASCEPLHAHAIHAIGGGALFACLSPTIPQADVQPLALGLIAWHKELKPAVETTVVFRDSAFADDVAKTNLTHTLKQHGLTTVRSL